MTWSKPDSERLSLWVQCAFTTLVALGAAYASYRHGRDFALRFGADATTAAIWPLIVDGLLTTATVELWKPSGLATACSALGSRVAEPGAEAASRRSPRVVV